jgi:Uri superfamily endonuclease
VRARREPRSVEAATPPTTTPPASPPVGSPPTAAPPVALNALYVVATLVPRRETIVVGALGAVTFARGWQAYVGSARRGRDARVARHHRRDKPLRWHADYLFTRHPATRAWLLDTPLIECELAALLRAAVEDAAAPDGATSCFGASDCGCAGHLVSTARLGELRAALGAAAARGGTLRALPVERRKRD